MFGFDFIFCQHRRRIVKVGIAEAAARLGVQHFDFIRHQLHHVGVAGHDDRIDALVGGLFTQCAEQVVGLKAVQFVDGDIESPNQFPYPPELSRQFRRSFRTRRLVVFKHLVAESGSLAVESDGIMRRFQVVQSFQQNRGEAVNRSHRFPGLAHRKRRQSMESAVYQTVPVEEHQ